MNRTLNQLRWILVSYVTRMETPVNLVITVLFLFMSSFMFISIGSIQQFSASINFFQAIVICLLTWSWVYVQTSVPLTKQRSVELSWIAPNYIFPHIIIAIGSILIFPAAQTLVLTIFGANPVTWLPVLIASSLLGGCMVAADAFKSNQAIRLFSFFSCWLIGISIFIVIQSNVAVEPTKLMEQISSAPIAYLRGELPWLVPFVWGINAILLVTFCTLLTNYREFKSIDRPAGRTSDVVDNQRDLATAPSLSILQWADSSCDRRLIRHLGRKHSRGTWNEIQQWRVANRSGTITWWILAYLTMFFPFGFYFISIPTRWLEVIPTMMIVGMFLFPFPVIREWRKRRKTLELELLRPQKRVSFQLELAAAFLLDLLPIILLATIGMFSLAVLSERDSIQTDITRFLLFCGPTAILFLIASCSALVLNDELSHQIGIIILSGFANLLALIAVHTVATYPWHVLCLSAVIAVMSIMSLSGLYKYWEDMELGRVNREGLEEP